MPEMWSLGASEVLWGAYGLRGSWGRKGNQANTKGGFH